MMGARRGRGSRGPEPPSAWMHPRIGSDGAQSGRELAARRRAAADNSSSVGGAARSLSGHDACIAE